MADFIFRKSFQCTKRKTLRNYTSRQEPQEPTLSSQIVFRSIDLISLHINREFDLQDEGPKSTVLEPFWFFSPVTLQRSVPHPVSSFMIMGVWYEKAVYTVWFRMCNFGNSELRLQCTTTKLVKVQREFFFSLQKKTNFFQIFFFLFIYMHGNLMMISRAALKSRFFLPFFLQIHSLFHLAL